MTDANIALLVGLFLMAPFVAWGRHVGIPYPITLVVGGLVLGFVPGLPVMTLDPNLVLLLFLPPLLFWESITAPIDVMRANARQIGALTIGLVTASICAVAVTMHTVVPGLPWAVAFVLGAIVSPTDELAAVPILERFKIPRHVVAIVEGESLTNDALSLVLYSAALVAALTGIVDVAHIALSVILGSLLAVVIGIVVAGVVVEFWKHIDDPQLQGVLTVILSFLAYIPAVRLGASGVIAAVTAGVYASRFTPRVLTPVTRLQGIPFWESFVFLSNALLFLLVGLQLHRVAGAVLAEYSWPTVLWYTVAINLVVVCVRFAWTLGMSYLPIIGATSTHAPGEWQHALIIACCGFRGAVSLAAALAIPLTLANGTNFPHRDLLIFLTYAVILVTLVGGGLVLPVVLKRLDVTTTADDEERELESAVAAIVDAARRIDALERNGSVDAQHAQQLRGRYARMRGSFSQGETDESLQDRNQRSSAEREIIAAARDELLVMGELGTIDNAVLRRVQTHLDLAEQTAKYT